MEPEKEARVIRVHRNEHLSLAEVAAGTSGELLRLLRDPELALKMVSARAGEASAAWAQLIDGLERINAVAANALDKEGARAAWFEQREFGRIAFLNGAYVPVEDLNVHLISHLAQYGTNFFEGIRAYYDPARKKPVVFKLSAHVERWQASAKAYGFELPYTSQQLEDAILNVVAASGFESCYIRPSAGPDINKGLNPAQGLGMNVGIACWRWGKYVGGLDTEISPVVRLSPSAFPIHSKAGGHYTNSVYALLKKTPGIAEVILLDEHGNLAEGPGENLAVIRDGRVMFPAASHTLEGITRACVIDILRNAMGVRVSERTISVDELLNKCQGAFFTGTAAEIAPIHTVDDHLIGDGVTHPIVTELSRRFLLAASGQDPTRAHWVTAVPPVTVQFA